MKFENYPLLQSNVDPSLLTKKTCFCIHSRRRCLEQVEAKEPSALYFAFPGTISSKNYLSLLPNVNTIHELYLWLAPRPSIEGQIRPSAHQ